MNAKGDSTERSRARAEYHKQYAEANREKIRAYQAAYREANRERISRERKEDRAADPEGALAAERAMRERKRARDARRLAHNAYTRQVRDKDPEAARERSRRFRQEHPDKIREYQRRYKERHPERARQNQAATAQRHRDAHADEIRERQRLLAAKRRREHPEWYQEWYQRNIETQRARGRDAARLRARLKKAGLPPRSIHRIYTSDVRANDAAADNYFTRERSVEELAVIAIESERRSALHIPRAVRTLRNEMLDGPLPAAEHLRDSIDNRVRKPGEVELTSKRYLIAMRHLRDRELEQLRAAHVRTVQSIRDSRPQIYEHHYYRRVAELRVEIKMDSIARVARGLEPYDPKEEFRRRIEAEVTPIVNAKLAAAKEATLERIDHVLARYRRDIDPAAPYQPPGSPPSSELGLR